MVTAARRRRAPALAGARSEPVALSGNLSDAPMVISGRDASTDGF